MADSNMDSLILGRLEAGSRTVHKPRKLHKRVSKAASALLTPADVEENLNEAKNRARRLKKRLQSAEATRKTVAEEVAQAERDRRRLEGRKQSIEAEGRRRKRATISSPKKLRPLLRPLRPSYDADSRVEDEYSTVRGLVLQGPGEDKGAASSLASVLRSAFGFFTAIEHISADALRTWQPDVPELYQRGLLVESTSPVLYYIHYNGATDDLNAEQALITIK